MCHLAQHHKRRFYKNFLSDSAEPNAIGHDDMADTMSQAANWPGSTPAPPKGRVCQLILHQQFVAEIDNHRIEAAVKPGLEDTQAPILRPSGLVHPPAGKVVLEYPGIHLLQASSELFLILAFRYEVNIGLLREVLERDFRTSGVNAMEPIEKWRSKNLRVGSPSNSLIRSPSEMSARMVPHPSPLCRQRVGQS
jgi:hypothetical protein